MLIAIMADSYEKVKESERVEGIRERARIVVEQEKRFPTSHRYHRFLHFVETTDSSRKEHEMAWEGVTKRVSQTLSLEVGRLEGKIDKELAELKDELSSRIELMDKELIGLKDEVNRKLDTLLDRN